MTGYNIKIENLHEIILRSRKNSMSWKAIADGIGITQDTLRDRAKKMGIYHVKKSIAIRKIVNDNPNFRMQFGPHPLTAGHSISVGAISVPYRDRESVADAT